MKEGGGFPQSKLLRYREITTSQTKIWILQKRSTPGKHVSSSGNRVSFSGKHVSFTGNRASFTGAAGGRDLGASADADAESKICQSHFCPRSGNCVSFCGNRVSFRGSRGARGRLGPCQRHGVPCLWHGIPRQWHGSPCHWHGIGTADAESKICQSHFCPEPFFRSRIARGENVNQARRRRNEKNEKSECRKRKPQ